MWLSGAVSRRGLAGPVKRLGSDPGRDRKEEPSVADERPGLPPGYPTSDEVRTVEFRQTLRGYNIDEVDSLLQRVATEMEAGRSPRGLVRKATFRQTLRGYHADDVDNFMARLAGHPGAVAQNDRPSGFSAAVVTCMDGRVDPARLLGLASESAHIIRNAGGIVTDDVIRSLAVSQRVLGTDKITIIQHTDCGMLRITDEAFARTIQRETGVSPPWAPGAFSDLYESVRQGMGRITSSPFIPNRDEVIGFVYDLEADRLDQVSEVRGVGKHHVHSKSGGSNSSQWGGWW